MPTPLILAIDQGTTSTRAVVFSRDGRVVAEGRRGFRQHYPRDGWVEHDPEEIWRGVVAACREALAGCGGAGEVVAIGIANQRETTLVWERASGEVIYPAIVWQDRRTAAHCARLEVAGLGERVRAKTGLVLDAYFSASKIAWLLDHIDGARARAEAGELAFGTIDTFLIWRLTGGHEHLTDASNASRTLLFNIHTQAWDDELLQAFAVPRGMLPEVRDCADDFGSSDKALFGRAIPIGGVAGDQHAALVGQACFAPGMVKSTYGSGCFVMLNSGAQPVASKNRLLSTLGYRIDGRVTYALEGSIFNAGTAVQWLRDDLGLFADNREIDALIRATCGNRGVYMVPAFTGLGAPHWDPDARAALLGLTRDTSKAQLVRAALEAVCYQTHDLLAAMCEDSGADLRALRVDGGMAVNDWLLQFLADLSGITVERPVVTETTALGAAYLAALRCGLFDSVEQISKQWRKQRGFAPGGDRQTTAAALAGWKDALRRVKSAAVGG